MSVLSIQSHVAYGHVGNAAAAFALQRLGIEVAVVDRYANAPAHQVGHRAHVIDMTDAAALRALVEQERPHLIVPEIEAIATAALAAIESERLAEVIPTARAALSDSPLLLDRLL